MPTPRKHTCAAERQAAYRQRTAAAIAAILAARGLPGTAPIASMPSTRRWDALADHAHSLLQTLYDEIESYYDERSEAWQETENAEEFQERLGHIEEAINSLQEANR